MACSMAKLLPDSRLPVRTHLSASPFSFEPSSLLTSCTVSSRTKKCGRRNKLHVCVVLNASSALSWSTTWSGIAKILPLLSPLAIVSGASSPSPGTGRALLLLSWMRFRKALRSPAPGFLTGTMLDFFLYVFLVFFGRSLLLLIVGGGAAATAELVEKAAMASMMGWIRGATGIDGLIRLRKAFADAMVALPEGVSKICSYQAATGFAYRRVEANWAGCGRSAVGTRSYEVVLGKNLQRGSDTPGSCRGLPSAARTLAGRRKIWRR